MNVNNGGLQMRNGKRGKGFKENGRCLLPFPIWVCLPVHFANCKYARIVRYDLEDYVRSLFEHCEYGMVERTGAPHRVQDALPVSIELRNNGVETIGRE